MAKHDEAIAEFSSVREFHSGLSLRLDIIPTSALLANMIAMQADASLNADTFRAIPSVDGGPVADAARAMVAQQKATLEAIKVEVDKRFPWPPKSYSRDDET